MRRPDQRPAIPRWTPTASAPAEQLDLAAAIETSQAISGELLLDRLIDRLLTVAIEHAGAARGLLLLPSGDKLRIEAEATTDRDKVAVQLRQAAPTTAELPESILRYVLYTLQSIVVDDASADDLFSGDDYVRRKGLRSVLCSPLLKQGQLIGVLYLENHLKSRVFTPARVAVLQLLASQAAISLENARLYSQLLRENSERARAEEALSLTKAGLARVSRVMTMGELTASIAHEVNQPCAAIMTNGHACLNFLKRTPPDLEKVRAAVEQIIVSAKRGSDVIARIRALVTKTNGHKTSLDINQVAEEVAALVHGEARKHGVLLRTELAPALPPIEGDRVELQQVFLNLLMNGIEASEGASDRPRDLIIRSQPYAPESVLVAVQDEGVGFDPDQGSHLFEAFYTTKPGGMGMGLAISRSIVEAHRGRLWASRNSGPGATFQFVIPAQGQPAA